MNSQQASHLEDMQREIDVLRDDFQKLEEMFHVLQEKLETDIENILETIQSK